MSNMDNYRPISVLPTISKVLERVVHRQLMNYYDMVMLILCYTSATYDLTSYLLTIYKRIRKQQNVPLTMALPKCRGVNPGGFGGGCESPPQSSKSTVLSGKTRLFVGQKKKQVF